MAGWSGFTDEDLHRLKKESDSKLRETGQPEKQQKTATNHERNRPFHLKENKRTHQNRRKMPLKCEELYNQNEKEESENCNEKSRQTSLKSINDELPAEIISGKSLSENKNETENPNNKEDGEKEKNLTSAASEDKMEPKEELDIKIVPDEIVAEIELSELEKLQKRQKEIEAQNKIKKRLLNETINQRFKKAQHETVTLQNVQKELAKLDCLLAKDVEILRTRIEEETIAYCNAQKRYDKAEKEFVSAKLDLKLKSDRKEELTQHLFTIIQENELRKSAKLEELLGKLNVSEKTAEFQNESENKTVAEEIQQ